MDRALTYKMHPKMWFEAATYCPSYLKKMKNA
jgi:hypothetical protein